MFPKWIWLVLLLPVVLVVWILFAEWAAIRPEFYSLTIADLLDLYATVVFGVILATLVADRMGRRQRQLELRCGMLDRTSAIAASLWDAFERYVDDPSPTNRQRVLLLFKECSRFIDVIRGAFRADPKTQTASIIKAFHALKRAATDDGAGVRSAPEQWRERSHDRYCGFINEIWRQKSALFQQD